MRETCLKIIFYPIIFHDIRRHVCLIQLSIQKYFALRQYLSLNVGHLQKQNHTQRSHVTDHSHNLAHDL
jgi:hypothetical protein